MSGRTAASLALTREISPAFERCELTHLARQPIDLVAARAQHAAYEQCLRDEGYAVVRLPSDAHVPDSVFVEDIAVVFDETAIITRPGAESRRLETPAVAEAVRPHRRLDGIEAPGTMDGGDVLTIGRRVFVGESSRTNRSAIDQMARLLGPFGYSIRAVRVKGCLHLKSAVTLVSDDLLLANREWVDLGAFGSIDVVDVDPAEPSAANALRLEDAVIYSTAFPRTRRRMEQRGVRVVGVEVGELAKAEGGVTCCSLLVRRT